MVINLGIQFNWVYIYLNFLKVSMMMPHILDCCSSILTFESGSAIYSSFLRFVFTILGALHFLKKFRIHMLLPISITPKKPLRILTGTAFNL